MSPKIIITGRHLSDASRDEITRKTEKLLGHSEHIVRVRLDLHESGSHDGERYHTAKGVVEVRGPDLIASASTDSLLKSVHSVIEKLDRMLSERSHRMAEKRRHPHPVEIPAALPKVAE
jgi:putative sigma-54 modulation protein